jgi:hypothetical protein
MVLISYPPIQKDDIFMQIGDSEVCLSIQRALLDKVTQNLRRISFVLNNNFIKLYFFYNDKPSEIEEELVGDVSAEVISDLPEDYQINCELINVKYPEEIISQGRIIFNRFEPQITEV